MNNKKIKLLHKDDIDELIICDLMKKEVEEKFNLFKNSLIYKIDSEGYIEKWVIDDLIDSVTYNIFNKYKNTKDYFQKLDMIICDLMYKNGFEYINKNGKEYYHLLDLHEINEN